jgi:hypothetical protein
MKVGDMVLTIPGYGKTAAYGWEKCSAYAQSRAPPKFISANSDSYTWLATDAYFSQIWKTSFPRDEPEPSGDSEDIPDNDDTVVAPDQVCEAQGAPAQDDCSTLLLSIPDSADPIDPTKAGGCYTRDGTSYKWCDLYTAYSCQVTVGWDTSENGGTNPL